MIAGDLLMQYRAIPGVGSRTMMKLDTVIVLWEGSVESSRTICGLVDAVQSSAVAVIKVTPTVLEP